VIGWVNYNPKNQLELSAGLRLIPQIITKSIFPEDKKLDFEASANIFAIFPLYLSIPFIQMAKSSHIVFGQDIRANNSNCVPVCRKLISALPQFSVP